MRFNDCGRSQKFFKIVLLLVAAVMLSSVFMMTACQKPDSDPDTSPTASETSTTSSSPSLDLIKNGNFEDTYETQYPRVPRYWTSLADSFNGKNASRTDSKYGVISTDGEDFEDVLKDMFGRIPDPEKEEDADLRKKIEAVFGSSVPADANPGMHEDVVPEGGEDEDEEESLKNIIMLYNAATNPTATKYKSQSLSIPANSYARVSLYVKTLGLEPAQGAQDLGEHGATIAFSEGSTSIVALTGIDTAGVWKRYDFYLESSQASSKTIYIEIGLGHGGSEFIDGHTSGTVFFDEIGLEYISRAQYEEDAFSADVGRVVYTEDDLREDEGKHEGYYSKKLNVSNMSETAFAMTYIDRSKVTTESMADLSDTSVGDSPFFVKGKEPTGSSLQIDELKHTYENKVFVGTTPVLSDEEDDHKFAEALANYPFSGNKVLYMENQVPGINGVQVFQKTIPSFASDDLITGDKLFSHYRLSLFLKTSDFVANGLNIIMEYSQAGSDLAPKQQFFTNVNTKTSELSAEDLEKDANIHNKWDNWVEYSFYFEASPFADTEVSLYLWLGPENISGKQSYDLTKGWALFSEASLSMLTAEQYNAAPSSETVKSAIRLYDTASPQMENGNFNSFASGADSNHIRVMPLAPAGFTGYYGGDKRIVGENQATDNASSDIVKGIIDSRYLTEYLSKGLVPIGLTAEKLNPSGSNITPSSPRYLMIYNKSASAYGYQTAVKTLAANSVYTITVNVMTMDGAEAYIYLTDTDGNVFEQGDEAHDGGELLGVTYSFEKITDGAWTEYKFYIKTGDFSKSVRLELWNGDRFGNDKSQGTVFFDDAYMAVIDSKDYDELKEDFDSADTTLKWGDFTEIDIEEPEESPSPTTPSPTTPAEQPGDYTFPWGLLASLAIVVALMIALVSIAIRRFKKSKIKVKLTKATVVKKQKRSYDRKMLGKRLDAAGKKKSAAKTDALEDEELDTEEEIADSDAQDDDNIDSQAAEDGEVLDESAQEDNIDAQEDGPKDE